MLTNPLHVYTAQTAYLPPTRTRKIRWEIIFYVWLFLSCFACANKNIIECVYTYNARREHSHMNTTDKSASYTIEAVIINGGGRAVRGVRRVNFRLPLFTWGEAGAPGARGGGGAAACCSRSRAAGVGSLHRRAGDWSERRAASERRTARDRSP